MNTMEIVERSSGYWIVDDTGVVDGPFIELKEAMETLAQLEAADKINVWELMKDHIENHLGYYGLEFQDKFLDMKEQAEDLGLCPQEKDEHGRY